METFTLWHGHTDTRRRELSFYATAVNIQGLNRGTDQMVRQMLDDMGIDAAVREWAMARFVTDYLSDARDSDDWRDVWLETGDLRVTLDRVVVRRVPPPGFHETTAWDETWTGEPASSPACLVVADFKGRALAGMAAEVFGRLADAMDADGFASAVREGFPSVTRTRLRELWDGIGTGRLLAARCHDPLQLHVTVPADATFSEEGVRRAGAVEELCRALGATTFWRDRYAEEG